MLEIISFVLGFGAAYMFFIIGITKQLHNQEKQLKSTETTEMLYAMEKHNSTYYAFELDDTFIAQGTSFEELSANMQARYPNTKFVLASFSAEISDEIQQQLIQLGTEIIKLTGKTNDRN